MRILIISLLALAMLGCASRPGRPQIETRGDWQGLFEAENLSGVFVLFDPTTGRWQSNDPTRAETGSLPASTFKIPNSLIALETGVASGPDMMLPWDGVERWIKAWNQDLTLAQALRESAVWYYQELARRIGPERMQHHLDALRYGNRDMSAGIDLFWLQGNMKVTPVDQVQMLERLARDALPFRKAVQIQMREMLVLSREQGAVLRGKTGWVLRDGSDLGWFVGWTERADTRCVFALRIDMPSEDYVPRRRALAERLLRAESCLPPAS